jgi:hypothetical protein
MSDAVWVGVGIGSTETAVVVSSGPPEGFCRAEFTTLPAKDPQRAIDLIVRSSCELLGSGPTKGASRFGHRNHPSAAESLSWVGVPSTSILRREFGGACAPENGSSLA